MKIVTRSALGAMAGGQNGAAAATVMRSAPQPQTAYTTASRSTKRSATCAKPQWRRAPEMLVGIHRDPLRDGGLVLP